MECTDGDVWAKRWASQSKPSGSTARCGHAAITLPFALQFEPELCGSARVCASSDDGARRRSASRARRCGEWWCSRHRKLHSTVLSEPLSTAIRQSDKCAGRSLVQTTILSASRQSEPTTTVYCSVTFTIRPTGLFHTAESRELESKLWSSYLPLQQSTVSAASANVIPSSAIAVPVCRSCSLRKSCLGGTWITGHHSRS